ncbi:M1-specific T cell receptor beta chain [Alosa alosa]|uniref:M1-specific T cell receptor beta chain n=1 Tax=Alosa alosa TaxID=278164 RepID=UPI002015206D|nr:M1-specific T cell receptor beta chain [Alosa alosa]
MFWYRQGSNKDLSLVAFSINKEFTEIVAPFDKRKYAFNRPVVKTGSLQIHSLEAEDSAVYYCASSMAHCCATGSQAYFGKGTKLTVLEEGLKVTAPTVKLLPPSKSEPCDKVQKKRKERSVTLVCLATNFYPDHVNVSWKVSGVNRTDGVGTDNNALRSEDKMYSITSRLRIGIKEWANPNTQVTCVVRFFNGTHNVDYDDSVNGQLVPGMVDPDSYVNSAQTAKFAYSIFIAKSCLFGLFIFFFVRKCSGTAAHFGPGTKVTVLDPNINVTKPDVKILPPSPKEICASENDQGNVTLVCVATNFYPDHVAVSWMLNDENATLRVGTDINAHRINESAKYSISSRLRVLKSVWKNTTNMFTCSVQFFDGEDYITVTDTIYGQNKLSADRVRRYMNTARYAYLLFLVKSMVYAVVVGGLVWKIGRGNKKAVSE